MPPPIHRLYGFGITEVQNNGTTLPGQPRVLNFLGGATPDPSDPTVIDISTGGSGVDHHQTDEYIATNGQTIFALSLTPVDPADVEMTVNGQAQTNGVAFTVSGTTLTWLNFPLIAGDEVTIDYDV